jgi:diguanylate cyclase (GGDEF)-like protein
MAMDALSKLLKQSMGVIARAKRRRKHIEHRAFHDELTGLPNRYLFSDRLEQALAQAHHRRPCSFAVAFIDIDRFKIVNDAFGHGAGDELLRHIAACLTATLRAGDTAARLGGDEFVLLLVDVSDAAVVHREIDRINTALRQPVSIDGHYLAPSCSIGVSFFPQDGVDARSLLKRADAAMYAKKNAGRANLQGITASSTVDLGALVHRRLEYDDGCPGSSGRRVQSADIRRPPHGYSLHT